MMMRLVRSDWSLHGARGLVVGGNATSLLVLGALMEPAGFGRFVYWWSVALVLSVVASLGGQPFLLREMSARQGHPARGVRRGRALRIALVWPGLILSATALAALWIAPAAAALAGRTGPPPAVLVLVPAAAYMINLSGHAALPLRVDGHAIAAMLLKDGGPQLLLLAAALMLSAGGGLDPVRLLATFVLLAVLAVAAVAAVLAQRSAARPLWREAGTGPPPGAALGFWGSTVLGAAWTQADILLGGLVLPAAELGAYQILKRLANLAASPQIVANWTVVVGIGRAYAAGDRVAIQAECRRAARLAVGPALLFGLAVAAGLPMVLQFYGIAGEPGVWLAFALLLLAAWSNVGFGASFVVAIQCHLERVAVAARLVAIACCTVPVLALAAALSPAGLAAAYAAGSLASNLFLWAVNRRRLGVDSSALCLLGRMRTDAVLP